MTEQHLSPSLLLQNLHPSWCFPGGLPALPQAIPSPLNSNFPRDLLRPGCAEECWQVRRRSEPGQRHFKPGPSAHTLIYREELPHLSSLLLHLPSFTAGFKKTLPPRQSIQASLLLPMQGMLHRPGGTQCPRSAVNKHFFFSRGLWEVSSSRNPAPEQMCSPT